MGGAETTAAGATAVALPAGASSVARPRESRAARPDGMPPWAEAGTTCRGGAAAGAGAAGGGGGGAGAAATGAEAGAGAGAGGGGAVTGAVAAGLAGVAV